MERRLTAKQWKRMGRLKVTRHYTLWWYPFRLLRWLGLKDIAYAVFRRVPIYDVYVNGRYVRTAHVVRRKMQVVGTKRVPLASEIQDPPPVIPARS